MQVLVTGGTGSVGRAAVERLVRAGHAVRVVGRRAEADVPGAEYAVCDIGDPASLAAVMAGVDAVLHLAAIANPALGPGHEIFRVNCGGTFNVYTAAARAGVRRVVQASSINALGYNFGVVEAPPRWLPVDEEHPPFTTDPYSFSKQVAEQTAEYFWRRDGISGASLRLPWVYEVPAEGTQARADRRAWHRKTVENHRAIMRLPAAERLGRVKSLSAAWAEVRSTRVFERPYEKQDHGKHPDIAVLGMRSNLWATVDARDSAQAIEKALTVAYEGSHVLYVNDSRNTPGLPARDLAETFFPGVEVRGEELAGDASLVSIEKARRLLGFEPEHSMCRDP